MWTPSDLQRVLFREAKRDARRLLRQRQLPRGVLTGASNAGFCCICDVNTRFVERGPWLRDQYVCVLCGSIPRQRALIHALETQFPNWRALRIHESSPGGKSSDKLARQCTEYLASQYYSDVPPGQSRDGFRSENLERQTFAEAAFDLVITQDVFEHVLNPAPAFAEIARTLRPGGAHVFTVPWYYWKPTLIRAEQDSAGNVRHLEPPEYHRNPIDPEGSLVTREWGTDLLEQIRGYCGLETQVMHLWDRALGIDGEFREVFISRKPG